MCYADGASVCGSLRNLRLWWEKVFQLGPQFGYFLACHEEAVPYQLLSATSANIMTDGRLYLGVVIWSQAVLTDYISSKVSF